MDSKSLDFFRAVVPGWTPPRGSAADLQDIDAEGKPIDRRKSAPKWVDRPVRFDPSDPTEKQIAAARAARLKVEKWTFGVLFQEGGIWIGAHYSKAERRWCINFLPCLTIYAVLPGGNLPKRKLK